MPSFDHVVTQWMSPSYVDGGSAWISSHVHVVGVSTSPSIAKVHVAVSSFGVTSAVNTGHPRPVSYWPGGRRGSRSALPLPENPLVNFTARLLPVADFSEHSKLDGSLEALEASCKRKT